MRKIDIEFTMFVAICAGCLMVGALLGGIAAQSERTQQVQYSQMTQDRPQFKLDPSAKIERKLMVCENNENWAWFSVLPVDPELTNKPVKIEIKSADEKLLLQLEPGEAPESVKVTRIGPGNEAEIFSALGPVEVKVLPLHPSNPHHMLAQSSFFYLRGVVETLDGTPVEGAEVKVDRLPGQSVKTTTNGDFSIQAIPGKPGEQIRVYVKSPGYVSRNEYTFLPGPVRIRLDKEKVRQ